jgi:hypothetical protein
MRDYQQRLREFDPTEFELVRPAERPAVAV